MQNDILISYQNTRIIQHLLNYGLKEALQRRIWENENIRSSTKKWTNQFCTIRVNSWAIRCRRQLCGWTRALSCPRGRATCGERPARGRDAVGRAEKGTRSVGKIVIIRIVRLWWHGEKSQSAIRCFAGRRPIRMRGRTWWTWTWSRSGLVPFGIQDCPRSQLPFLPSLRYI